VGTAVQAGATPGAIGGGMAGTATWAQAGAAKAVIRIIAVSIFANLGI